MDTATRTVQLSEIPHYLREGQLFSTLVANKHGGVNDGMTDAIVVPEGCMKAGPWVKSVQDTEELLNTLRYWMVPNLPHQLYDFALSLDASSSAAAGFDAAVEPFMPQFAQLQALLTVRRESCREKQLVAAVRCNDMGILKYLWEDTERSWTNDECVVAAELGNLEALQYAHTHGCGWFNPGKKKVIPPEDPFGEPRKPVRRCACYAALRRSHLSCYQYARTRGCICDYDTRVGLCAKWTPECLAYVMREDILTVSLDSQGINQAFADGWAQEAMNRDSTRMLQNLHDLGWRADASYVHFVLNHGTAKMLAFVVRHDGELRGCEVAHLVDKGRSDELQPLLERGLILVGEDVRQILQQNRKNGRAIVTQAITHNQCTRCRGVLMALLGEVGDSTPYDLLELAFAHGFERPEQLCAAAAEEGNLALLQFAVRHGCPLTAVVYESAVVGGDLPCLQYLVESGSVPLTAGMATAAQLTNQDQCLDYLLSQGCPTDDGTMPAFAAEELVHFHVAHKFYQRSAERP